MGFSTWINTDGMVENVAEFVNAKGLFVDYYIDIH